MCGTLTEHTLVKLDINSDTDYIFIRHGTSLLAGLLRTMLNYYIVLPLLLLNFKSVCSVKVSHMTDSVDPTVHVRLCLLERC